MPDCSLLIAHCSLLIAHCSLLIAHCSLRNWACLARHRCPDLDPVNAKEFSERLWDFAAGVACIVESIPETRVGRHVAAQLIRCGTSSAPNYDEACDAESRRDFAHKLSIAAKEMRETSGWLRFLIKVRLVPTTQVDPLLEESIELRKMLGRSLKTLATRADLAAATNPNASQ